MELRLARFLSRKTQIDIALAVGMSPGTYSLVERGYRKPKRGERERIAAALGVSVEQIEWAPPKKANGGLYGE